jgi:hypothetical protein
MALPPARSTDPHAMARRDFLRATLSGATLLGIHGIPALCAADATADPVRSGASNLDPLVRLIEDRPREALLEEIGARIRSGLAYPDLLAALLQAGVRSIEPRPVGFKFHAVLAIHAAHQASQASVDADRWLPIFWSLDDFKTSQAQQRAISPWQLGAPRASSLPPASKARQAFLDAMERWDREAADAAATSLARHLGPAEVFELFATVGARDFRDIGHKVIYVAGAFRLLQVLGWQHAEPVLRSLALALNDHGGENPAQSDQAPDRAGRRNLERLSAIRADWARGADGAATQRLFTALRTASEDEAPQAVVELLNGGAGPAALWDALLAASAEIALRSPNLVSFHSLTTMNALHYCFEASTSDATRRFLLLQSAAFLPNFRGSTRAGLELDRLEAADGAPSVEDIFADVETDAPSAARKLLAYLRSGGNRQAVSDAARRLVLAKGRDAHDYKYSSAVLEDVAHLSAEWRDRYLAGALGCLKGSSAPDSELVDRTRAALSG